MFIRKLAIASLAVVALSLTACAGGDDSNPEAAPEANITEAKRAGGRFETFEGIDGKQYFRLVAANGLNLLRSEAYEKAAGPSKAIDSLMKAVSDGDGRRFVVLDSPTVSGGAYVNVLGAGSSGEIIATSETYSSKDKAENARKTIIGYLKGIAKVEFAPAATGKRFELFKLSDDEAPRVNGSIQGFKFLVRADNGETVLSSEFYATKQAAQKGIDAVKDYGSIKANYEVKPSGEGRGVFGLFAHEHSAKGDPAHGAGNHESIGFSEVYSNASNAQRGADAVRDLLQANLDVKDLSQ